MFCKLARGFREKKYIYIFLENGEKKLPLVVAGRYEVSLREREILSERA